MDELLEDVLTFMNISDLILLRMEIFHTKF